MRVNITLILLGVVVALSYTTYSLYEQNKLKDTIISTLNSSIARNNEMIKELEIDVQKYKNKAPMIREKIITKYKTIQAQDEQCLNQIKAVDESISTFFAR